MDNLDIDSLSHCTKNLSLQDVSNMAMTCKKVNQTACSDPVWHQLYRREWPGATTLYESGMRESYMSKHIALRQFKYADPVVRVAKIRPILWAPPNRLPCCPIEPGYVFFDNNYIIFHKHRTVHYHQIDDLINWRADSNSGHDNGILTFMRLFSLNGNQSHSDNVLVTSSADHLRLWSNKGGCQPWRGHTGSVSAISDRVLNDGKLFASGGEDNTVRLWSINSTGKRFHLSLKASPTFKYDYLPPKATFNGHETPVSLISVAGHNASQLVSVSKDGKVCAWETNEVPSSSSCPVGTTSVPVSRPPLTMKCHESLLYIAADSSIISIDLRTMETVSTLVLPGRIYSFEALPSKSLFCTGEDSRAKLWDNRKIHNEAAEPVAYLAGHEGPVELLHIDPYKVVTGGSYDPLIKVWAADTGVPTNSLSCSGPHESLRTDGCSAMAVDGCRIVTASILYDYENFFLTYRDFTNATCDVQSSNVSRASTNDYVCRGRSEGYEGRHVPWWYKW